MAVQCLILVIVLMVPIIVPPVMRLVAGTSLWVLYTTLTSETQIA
jgi:hypothetical protein